MPDIYAKMICHELIIKCEGDTRNKKKRVYLIVMYIAFEICYVTYCSIQNFLIIFLDKLTNYLKFNHRMVG